MTSETDAVERAFSAIDAESLSAAAEHALGVLRARFAELEGRAARGGTMTAEEVTEALECINPAHFPNIQDRLRQHIAAKGARIAALETQRDAFLADLRVLKPAIAYEMAPRAAITCNDGLMEDCFRLQSDMARNLKRERERRHEAEMLHGKRVADLEQHIADLEKSLENARSSEKVWRDRVEQAAEALSDVLSGEVGRIDLLARISEVKRQRDAAVAANAELLKAGSEMLDVLTMGAVVFTEADYRARLTALGQATTAPHPGAALLERVKRLEDAATKASAELRHTFRPETRDWNLVARAIRILEGITTPNAGGH